MTGTSQDKRKATKVTLVGALLDLLLGVLKITIGLFSNSYALITDGIHSLSDLVTDAFVLIITRISREAPDAEHPYGHGRFETLGTIIIGITLFTVAGVIIYDSLHRLIGGETLEVPGLTALVVAFLSIISKEWIYRYTKKVATEIKSSLLLANAWHSRTDALSSIAVLIGIIGALAGFPWMDTVAAIFVGLMIGRIAWSLVASSLKELVDTALPEEELNAIKQHINTAKGVVDAHSVRSRLHGGHIFLDIHVQVDSKISVSEGHYLADSLSQSLIQSFPKISDLVVHIDPELDTHESTVYLLPARAQVESQLLECWQGLLSADDIEKVNLHYLNEKIQVEIFLKNSFINNELKDTLKDKSKDLNWLSEIAVYGIY